ncbi:MAG: ABC transporter permease [Blastocatellia bacterium]|nr:ABC transporter permease [Blastocatellia bacterium]
MSTEVKVSLMEQVQSNTRLSFWFHQTLSIIKLEIRKNFWGRRILPIYLFSLTPVAIFFLMNLYPTPSKSLGHPTTAATIFANIHEGVIVRTIVFFGCSWIFTNLFRGEILDRSLHYYFLAPVKRELIVLGKYFSGLIVSATLFISSTVVSLLLYYYPRGYEASMQYLLAGSGLKQAFMYLVITGLACFGYGVVFLVLGLLFRNPMIPAGAIYGWESINFLLPPFLKKVSIIHYLNSFRPVPISEGPFAIVAEPTPIWLSITSLLVIAVILLVFASYRIRSMEVNYTD